MTELVTLATAVVALATAVVAWLTRRKVKDVDAAVQEVHVMVNSSQAELKGHIRDLVAALNAAGIAVPAEREPETP